MQQKSYRTLLYFITMVILVTLAIQVYWNFKNYQSSKQQLINEVQISLDNAVNQYYEELAKDETVNFISEGSYFKHTSGSKNFNHILDSIKSYFEKAIHNDSNKTHQATFIRRKIVDSLEQFLNTINSNDSAKSFINIMECSDIIIEDITPIESLTSKIVISIGQDKLEESKIDSLLKIELSRKNITVDYELSYKEEGAPLDTIKKESPKLAKHQKRLFTKSKSIYLPPNSFIELYFSNTTLTILKKNLFGILLSFLLVISVIGCLLYLLKIINHQKQLAELKNDLISNITHEFKTPIATISAAIEGIQSFNQENNQEKTKKYAAISSDQLGKLNTMVEKILETATLDNDKLQLNFEEVNLVELVDMIAKKHMANSPEKNITNLSSHENIWKKADVFHLENAINNIVDNAIKYGGETISITINNTDSNITIEIKDTGTSLSKIHREKIFEKFYRVPKGNTHDIKGFGIGLFYAKTIIEKHNGTIQLLLDQGVTNFKIVLPNG
ncbi:HAMP domain-containing sensor histidine kinase [Aquimarina sp. 2201CG1-2-11]|uniref:sensor histidine kinase n=1 Tax=Aquimarina discodermiae TaxID=3231043 RepID=UPI003462DA66